MLWVGIVVAALGMAAGGIYYYEQYVQPKPGTTTTDQIHGVATLQQAQDNLKSAQTASDRSLAYEILGNEYMNNGKYPEAADALEKALPNSPEPIAVLSQLNVAYGITGQKAQQATVLLKLAAIYQKSSDPSAKKAAESYQKQAGYLQGGQSQ